MTTKTKTGNLWLPRRAFLAGGVASFAFIRSGIGRAAGDHRQRQDDRTRPDAGGA